MHGPPLPDRRLLVTDRGEQRVREANRGVVELDHSFVGAGLECRDDALAISVRGRDQIDRRPGERCDSQQDVEGLAGQPREAAAEQLLQGLGHRQGSAGRQGACPCVRARAPARARRRDCPPSPPARGRARGGSARARVAPRAGGAPRPRLSGPSEIRSSRPSGNARSSSKGSPSSGAFRTVASRPTGSSLSRRSAICSTAAEAGSSHCASSSATSTDPWSARTRRMSSTASPIACGSGATSPGSASISAISSARRRGGASEGPASTSTLPSRSESPAKESEASASTPWQINTRSKRSRASSRPAFQRIVLPIPASPESTSAPWTVADARDERADRAQLLVAPDDLRGHAHLSPRPPRPATAQGVLQGRRDARRACDRRVRGEPRPCSPP